MTPPRIFFSGLVLAAAVMVAGNLMARHLDTSVKVLETECESERRPPALGYEDLVLICDAPSLSIGGSVGIQRQIAEANDEARLWGEWSYVLAVVIIAISTLPCVWYFLLARIRELRDAISGK
jgi:hypothetical protein